MHFAERDVEATPPWLTYYDEAEHAGSSARTLTPLAVADNRPDHAAERLTTAIRLHSDAYPRSRAFSLTRLATLHMTVGDPNEAVEIGRQAVSAAAGLHSRRMTEELHKLVHASKHHSSIPDVADLSHSLRSVISNV